MSIEIQTPKRSMTGIVFEMMCGAVLGALAIWLYVANVRELRVADGATIALALMFAISGVRLFMWSLDAKKLCARMDLEGESTPHEAAAARKQAMISFCTAGLLVVPLMATLNGGPAPLWSILVTGMLLAASVFYVVTLLREGDEYHRQQMRENAWRCFLIGQSGLLVYACGERLGLFAPATAWDVMVSLTALAAVLPVLGMGRKTSRAA